MNLSPGTAAARPAIPFLSGFEGTQIFGHGVDVLDTTEHAHRFRDDLALMARDGVRTFRACIPWHKVERRRGEYDWSWCDDYLGHARELGLRPIADPLHHTSFPEWLRHGFANPRFPDAYAAFLRAFAERYPWVRDYTIINEPLATAVLSGLLGVWYPRWRDRTAFLRIVLGMVRAIARATPMLEARVEGLRIVHVDTCERHHALDKGGRHWTDFHNDVRFVVLDLLTGRVDRAHPLWPELTRAGLRADEAAALRASPVRIDVLGLDYYPHSEHAWGAEGHSEEFEPWGFARTALDYVDRFGLPVMLSETNVRGTVEDRLGWLKHMVAESEALARALALRGARLEGFCWYPFVDSTDWCSLVCEPNRRIDPQGIYWLSPDFERQGSELSRLFARLARGEIGAADLPAYRFGADALGPRGVGKYLGRMTGWDWRERAA